MIYKSHHFLIRYNIDNQHLCIFDILKIAIMNAGVVGDKNTCGAFSPLDGNQGVSAAKKSIIALVTK